MTAVAAVPLQRDALLGPSAQRLELGLLGARTAAVLRRVTEGLAIDDIDRAVLRSATEMLDTTADAIESVQAGNQIKRDRTSVGFGAMAFTIELTAPTIPTADLPGFLRAMVGNLMALQTQVDSERARNLLPVFSMLADVATRQAGTAGEGGGSLL
jgi:hypothetical protein